MKRIFAILTIALAGAAFAQEDYLADDYIADVSGISEAESSSSVEEALPAVSSSSEEYVAEAATDTAAPEASAVASSSSGETYASTDYDTLFGTNTSGSAEPVEEEVMPAKSPFDDDSIPELKRCKYTFKSWGIGFSTWHNWRDETMNPERDWALALLVHHGRIWEMTSHGSITFMANGNFAFGEYKEAQVIGVIGGRYFFLNDIYSPYVGGGFGLGLQYDGYLNEYSKSTFGDKFGFGFAGNVEAGIVVFRTTTTQLELGASYDVLVNVLKMEPAVHVYGAFNFYLAINY
ncbi:MAG: hypothetical protein MJZ05_02615 [Fibrobacter sp.]|nr:hypothetical protein [Fibrobacter sp.]